MPISDGAEVFDEGSRVNSKFAAFVERLHPAYVALIERAPTEGGAIPDHGGAVRGVYLFTEAGDHL